VSDAGKRLNRRLMPRDGLLTRLMERARQVQYMLATEDCTKRCVVVAGKPVDLATYGQWLIAAIEDDSDDEKARQLVIAIL